jgi:hypothetical protein
VILVDTSVWVDHFRDGNSTLTELLERGAALTHNSREDHTPASAAAHLCMPVHR